MNRNLSPSVRRIRATVLAFSFFSIIYYIFLTQLVRWWALRVNNGSSDAISSDTCVWKYVRPPKSLNAFDMCLRENDMQSNKIRRFGSIEECDILLEQWQKRKEDGLFVDVGANIGECSLTLAANGAKTVAFEPQPSNFFYFQQSVLRASSGIKELLTLHSFGVGNETADRDIFVQNGNQANSVLDIPIADDDKTEIKMRSRKFTIKVKTLDGVLWPEGSVMPNITLLKLNVQGYEHKALIGARRLLEHNAIKTIRLTLSSRYLIKQGSSALNVCIMIEQYGFALQTDKGVRISPADCVTLNREKVSIIALL